MGNNPIWPFVKIHVENHERMQYSALYWQPSPENYRSAQKSTLVELNSATNTSLKDRLTKKWMGCNDVAHKLNKETNNIARNNNWKQNLSERTARKNWERIDKPTDGSFLFLDSGTVFVWKLPISSTPHEPIKSSFSFLECLSCLKTCISIA